MNAYSFVVVKPNRQSWPAKVAHRFYLVAGENLQDAYKNLAAELALTYDNLYEVYGKVMNQKILHSPYWSNVDESLVEDHQRWAAEEEMLSKNSDEAKAANAYVKIYEGPESIDQWHQRQLTRCERTRPHHHVALTQLLDSGYAISMHYDEFLKKEQGNHVVDISGLLGIDKEILANMTIQDIAKKIWSNTPT